MFRVDLNCDMGEGFGRYKLGEQEKVLKYITSANIACGFHSGDPTVMRETVKMALEHGVKVGAHPGFQDLVGFGRREIQVTPQEAYDIVVYQIGALQGFLMTQGEKMHHVKPHGGLYNMAARDKELAAAIAQAVYDISPELVLFGLSGSELTKAGEQLGLKTAHEVFADRTYQADGSLTSRAQQDAIIVNSQQSVKQVLQMVKEGKVLTQQQIEIPLRAHTICIHGDHDDAHEFARTIKESLEQHEVIVRPI